MFGYYDLLELRSFPTRRSSDLHHNRHGRAEVEHRTPFRELEPGRRDEAAERSADRVADRHDGDVQIATPRIDRKSTRLNSSHSQISYAVFCLKKKKK